MNDWFVKLAAVVVLVLAAVFVYSKMGPGIPITSVVTQKQDLFTVSGEGKVSVVPDTALVDLGITANNSDVKSAQNQANSVIKALTDSLKKLGIAEKDIKTANYSVYPNYDFQSGSNKIAGYQVSASLTVTVRQIDKVNQVIDAATAAGTNSVGGIQLTVDDEQKKKLTQQARDLAVKEAKDKAESLAKAAGITLGKVVNVVEEGNQPRPVPMMAKDSAIGSPSSPTQIQPGSTDITSTVTLYYETR